MYHLQKYQTKASRHECPNCHDPHSFTYYVDDERAAKIDIADWLVSQLRDRDTETPSNADFITA